MGSESWGLLVEIFSKSGKISFGSLTGDMNNQGCDSDRSFGEKRERARAMNVEDQS